MSTGLTAGRELDLLVAEHVLGYRRVPGIDWDYDGPCEPGEHLLPPGIDPAHEWDSVRPPSRGTIPFGYWVHGGYSTKLEEAWRVVEHLITQGLHVTLAVRSCAEKSYMVRVQNTFMSAGNAIVQAATPALAICLAALAAYGFPIGEQPGLYTGGKIGG